jgi:thiamine pyrophosphate-dependent acetolactate synthase large subunit-like protein
MSPWRFFRRHLGIFASIDAHCVAFAAEMRRNSDGRSLGQVSESRARSITSWCVAGRCMSYLREYLFRDEQARQPVRTLSGGERNRLLLAKALAAPSNLVIGPGFSGTLGYGSSTGLGMKVANPDRPVVSVSGDGCFLYGSSDLATAVQFGINRVTAVVNNASYGNVLRDQQRLYEGRHSGAVLTSCDFQTDARASGVPAGRWKRPTACAVH